MPSPVERPVSFREFMGAPDHAEQPSRPKLATAARFCRDNAPSMALQRLVGGNVPIQGLMAAVQTPEGAQRGVTEALAGLIKRESLIAYGVKDGVCFLAERNLGGMATWLTRAPRWAARLVACAVTLPLESLTWSDIKPWLGRPDYAYPERCAELPRPGDCPSHLPGDYADWLEPALAAAMVGAMAYYAAPRLAHLLHSLPSLRSVRPPEPRGDEESQLVPVSPEAAEPSSDSDSADAAPPSEPADAVHASPQATPRAPRPDIADGSGLGEPLLQAYAEALLPG